MESPVVRVRRRECQPQYNRGPARPGEGGYQVLTGAGRRRPSVEPGSGAPPTIRLRGRLLSRRRVLGPAAARRHRDRTRRTRRGIGLTHGRVPAIRQAPLARARNVAVNPSLISTMPESPPLRSPILVASARNPDITICARAARTALGDVPRSLLERRARRVVAAPSAEAARGLPRPVAIAREADVRQMVERPQHHEEIALAHLSSMKRDTASRTRSVLSPALT